MQRLYFLSLIAADRCGVWDIEKGINAEHRLESMSGMSVFFAGMLFSATQCRLDKAAVTARRISSF